MALITASDTFDIDLLDPEYAENLEPLVEWLNETNQNVVNALQGNLGDLNLSTQTVNLKVASGVRKFVRISGQVSHVAISRVISQPDSEILLTGYNWWPVAEGIEVIAEFTGETKERDIIIRIEFDV